MRKILLLVAAVALAIVVAQPTVTITPSEVAPGGTVTIAIVGADGETCGIEVRDPADALILTDSATLTGGSYTTSVDIPSTARTGEYTVAVTCTTSGSATGSFMVRVPPIVGGTPFRDYSPIITSLVVAAALVATGLMVYSKRK